jgi:hypothetical protein
VAATKFLAEMTAVDMQVYVVAEKSVKYPIKAKEQL